MMLQKLFLGLFALNSGFSLAAGIPAVDARGVDLFARQEDSCLHNGRKLSMIAKSYVQCGANER